MKEKKERVFDLRNPLDMIRFVVVHPVPFPGSYQVLVTKNGTLICDQCTFENYRTIFKSTKDEDFDQVVAITNDCEVGNCYCELCNENIGGEEE